MRDHLRVGFRREECAGRIEFPAQFSMIFNDSIVHKRNTANYVRMRIGLVGPAMRRPTGVTDSNAPGKRLRVEPTLEISELSDSATPIQRPDFESRNTRGIISAIFKPP
jgi:hypothetical protein